MYQKDLVSERGTLGWLVKRYVASRTDVSVKAREQYGWAASHIETGLGAIRVDRLEREDIARWLDEIASAGVDTDPPRLRTRLYVGASIPTGLQLVQGAHRIVNANSVLTLDRSSDSGPFPRSGRPPRLPRRSHDGVHPRCRRGYRPSMVHGLSSSRSARSNSPPSVVGRRRWSSTRSNTLKLGLEPADGSVL